MSDVLQRVINEKEDLVEKITKLNDFIDSNEVFNTLAINEQNRLRRQLTVMTEYADILEERISSFE